MPPSSSWRRWLPRLVVESVVVVFSILLALVVNEWRQEAEREARQDRATEAIRSELLHNYRALREVHPYHVQVADTLRALANAGAETVDSGVRPEGWYLPVDLVSAAWEAARSTGVTAQLDYPVLLDVARAYEKQATFQRRREELTASVVSMALERGAGSLRESPSGMAGVLNSLRTWEGQLIREYESALEGLGVPADSVAAPGDAPTPDSGAPDRAD